jgi:tripartite-type tricarboxylate transporter receptor subunit TctC
MKLQRRQFLHLAAGAVTVSTASRIAMAQVYPSRPITMIVPFAAGGTTDLIGRVISERMTRTLGRTIIIENVSGADGNIGTSRVLRARPDGYTIGLGFITTQVMNGALYSLPFDVLNDFAPISPLLEIPIILYGNKTLRATDLNELIVWLRANPNRAAGTYTNVSKVLFAALRKEFRIQLTLVPYRGEAPAMQDLIAGEIDLLLGTPNALTLMRSGTIKTYAVLSDRPLLQAPEIPTIQEMGLPSLSFSGWDGLFAPKATPTAIIRDLNAAAVEALADSAVRSRFIELGYEIFPRERQTPEAFGAMVKADSEKWWPIIKEYGLKAE